MKRKKYAIGFMILLLTAALAGATAFYLLPPDEIENDSMTLTGYRHLSVKTMEKVNASDEEVEKAIEDRLVAEDVCEIIKNEKISNGDIVNISFQGYLDAKHENDDLCRSKYDLEIGSQTFIDGFEKGLIGKKPGETVTLNLTFPITYANENYAGHDVKFVIEIHSIKKLYTKDTLTDGIIRSRTSYENVDALYEAVKMELAKKAEEAFEDNRRKQLWSVLMQKTTIKKYNASYLKQEMKSFEQSYEKHAKALNVDVETFITQYCQYTMDEYKQLEEKTCKQNAKKHMIVEAIAKNERIKADSYQKRLAQVEAFLIKKTEFEYQVKSETKNNNTTTEITTEKIQDKVTYKKDFYYHGITSQIKQRMMGKSYQENKDITLDQLAYVSVKHYDMNGKIQTGELVVNKMIAQDVVEIFYELYQNQYPIEKIILIDEYDADDEKSMSDNNTSCFNYRVTKRGTLSNHALGRAIDLNPKINPDVYPDETLPANAVIYRNRDVAACKGEYADDMIDKQDLAYKIFTKHGFFWGGNWKTHQDYQHFEKEGT